VAKRLTRYILIALVLGIVAGWATNALVDDGSGSHVDRRCGAPTDRRGHRELG